MGRMEWFDEHTGRRKGKDYATLFKVYTLRQLLFPQIKVAKVLKAFSLR